MINSSYEIVKLQVEDAQNLSILESESFSDAWSCKQFEKALISKNYLLLGVKTAADNAIISYITLSVIPSLENLVDGEFEIINIATKVDFRNKGYGNILLSYVIEYGRKHALQSIFLDVRESNLPAYKLYSKLGFQVISKRKDYYESDNGYEDAILMMYSYKETT